MIIACKISSVQMYFCQLLHAMKIVSPLRNTRDRELCLSAQQFGIFCTHKHKHFCGFQECRSPYIYKYIYVYP